MAYTRTLCYGAAILLLGLQLAVTSEYIVVCASSSYFFNIFNFCCFQFRRVLSGIVWSGSRRPRRRSTTSSTMPTTSGRRSGAGSASRVTSATPGWATATRTPVVSRARLSDKIYEHLVKLNSKLNLLFFVLEGFWGHIFRVPEQPCWLYTLIAL